MDLSGNIFKVALPPHSMPMLDSTEKYSPKVNMYDLSKYSDLSNLRDYQQGALHGLHFLSRDFSYRGSILGDSYFGRIAFGASSRRVRDLPESMSCFNPKHFEQVILRDLYFDLGPGGFGSDPELAPCNWQVREINGTTWVYCEEMQRTRNNVKGLPPQNINDSHRTISLCTPLADEYFLMVGFNFFAFEPIARTVANMYELAESIISTLELELTDSTEARVDTIKSKFPNVKYSKHRNPEEWKYFRLEVSGDEYTILEEGSPPPPWQP